MGALRHRVLVKIFISCHRPPVPLPEDVIFLPYEITITFMRKKCTCETAFNLTPVSSAKVISVLIIQVKSFDRSNSIQEPTLKFLSCSYPWFPVNSLCYTSRWDRIISKKLTGHDAAGGCNGLISDTIATFVRKTYESHRNYHQHSWTREITLIIIIIKEQVEPSQNHSERSWATYWESTNYRTIENSHIVHGTHTSDSTNVKVRNIQRAK